MEFNDGGVNLIPSHNIPDDMPDKWHAYSKEKPQGITWGQIPKAL